MPTTMEVREQREVSPATEQAPFAGERPEVRGLVEHKALFADSLLDSGTPETKRRRFATALSFTFQCLLIGVLLILPLMFTDALPQQQLLTMLVAPPPPPPPPPAAAPASVIRKVQSDLLNGQLRSPTRIPEKVQMIREEEAPPAAIGGGVIGGVPGGIPGGQLGGVIGGIIGQTSNAPELPKLAVAKRVRVSQGVTSGMLLKKFEPPYPLLARQARVQGEVVLHAIISKEGTIESLELISGHPMLAQTAIDAVRQWRYRPYLLNGQPIEVDTTVTVIFQLGG